jgi:hypothetical protein
MIPVSMHHYGGDRVLLLYYYSSYKIVTNTIISTPVVGRIVNGNQVIISTGNGQTLLCPIGQRFTMPTK